MQLRVVSHQASFKVGDLKGNFEKIIQLYSESDCDLVVFPELSLTGYNCKDLFLDGNFISTVEEYILKIAQLTGDKALLIAAPTMENNQLFNSAILLKNGKIEGIYHKHFLPNYDVFDEKRYFQPGRELSEIFQINGYKIRVLICEDIWHPEAELYNSHENCELAIVMNASPYAINKTSKRIKLLQAFSKKYNHKYVIYLNLVGAHDHLLFDGGSIVVADGEVLAVANKWQELSFATSSSHNGDNQIVNIDEIKTSSTTLKYLNTTSSRSNRDILHNQQLSNVNTNDVSSDNNPKIYNQELYLSAYNSVFFNEKVNGSRINISLNGINTTTNSYEENLYNQKLIDRRVNNQSGDNKIDEEEKALQYNPLNHLIIDNLSTRSSTNFNEQGDYRLYNSINAIHKIYNHRLHNALKESDIFNLNDETACDIYHGIILALREYSTYAGCNKFVIGLSGGIDSALVTVMAVDAFGPENLLCVAMPSKYSTQSSIDDAEELVKKLGCQLEVVPVNDIKSAFDRTLQPVMGILGDYDVTNENIQPRIRANILMAIANKENRLLLSTSNKSESAVGYCTIYGDMTGAYAPIVDIYKTQVYDICRWRNRLSDVIPETIVNKAPSAELRPDQKDSDSLPDYRCLDEILYNLIELRCDPIGFDQLLVERIKKLLYNNEFKRFQAPPGPKINSVMLSNDRRYPICLKLNLK